MVGCWCGVVICLEQGADLHMAQMMPLPLTVSCFSKIQIGFTFMVLAHLGSPGKRAVKRVCVCVCVMTFQMTIKTSMGTTTDINPVFVYTAFFLEVLLVQPGPLKQNL